MLKRIIKILSELLIGNEMMKPRQPAVIPLEQRAEIIAYWSAAVYSGVQDADKLRELFNEDEDDDCEKMFG